MKTLYKILISFSCSLLLAVGCTSVLDEEIVSGITADIYYADEKGINDALTAGYARLKDFYGQQPGYAMTNCGTDIYGVGRGGQWIKWHRYDPTLNSSVDFLSIAWRSFYKTINITNTVINRAPEVVEDQESLNRILGEARFLRSFVYFQLVQIWGDVHLTTEETVGVEVEANRTSESDIYSLLIIPDLDFAIQNLPESSSQIGRATQPAAKAIRARVAMVLEDWTTAESMLKSIINDYSFSLTDTYSELWDMNNEQNSEVIWSIQFTPDPLVSEANNGVNYFTPWYTKHPGLVNNAKDGSTWVGFKPTPYFYKLWDKSIDRRFQEGLKSVWYVANAASAPPGLTVGDTALYYSIDILTEEYKASKPYTIYDVNDLIADDSAWPQPTKVRDESRPGFGTKPSRDLIIARLADMYLLLSEALFHQGKKAEALSTINIIRSARAIDGKESEMEIGIDELSIDFILDERGRELFAEGERWFTLKRLGLLVERVKKYNPYGAAEFIKEYHNFRPIPLEQIDRTENVYPQNEGYN